MTMNDDNLKQLYYDMKGTLEQYDLTADYGDWSAGDIIEILETYKSRLGKLIGE